tara:strand:- start:213 stop:692 length:480 start_codon:yes stop_codon:yes gene_type:complete
MSRSPKGNNAFALAHGSRLAADSTHGVTCTFTGGCRVFDANISKKHEMHWRCERHGGANNHARANAKDEDCRDGIPGEARRQRIARFRNKQRKTPTFTAHIPTFLDKPERPRTVKKMTAKPKIDPEAAKLKAQKEAMELLGLNEQQVADFQALLNAGNE